MTTMETDNGYLTDIRPLERCTNEVVATE